MQFEQKLKISFFKTKKLFIHMKRVHTHKFNFFLFFTKSYSIFLPSSKSHRLQHVSSTLVDNYNGLAVGKTTATCLGVVGGRVFID